jgi:hypothetical protein
MQAIRFVIGSSGLPESLRMPLSQGTAMLIMEHIRNRRLTQLESIALRLNESFPQLDLEAAWRALPPNRQIMAQKKIGQLLVSGVDASLNNNFWQEFTETMQS